MAIFDAEKAKIKMAILTQPGHDNKAWYSRKNDEKKRTELIIEGMFRRFQKHKIAKTTQVLQFYDNQTGALIETKKAVG